MQLTGTIALELRSGAAAGERRVIAPCAAYRIGRARPADWAMSDPLLATVHLSIRYHDDGWWLEPARGERHVLLDGQAVTTPAVLRDGAWIRAGQSDLSAFQIGPLGGPALAAAHRPLLETLVAIEHLHFVLDAAQSPRVLHLLRRTADPSACLFGGLTRATLEDAAPYLVTPGPALLERIIAEGGHARWGIGLVSPRPFSLIRRHLRTLLYCEVDGTGPSLLRFYDPVALADLWEIATTAQRSLLLGVPRVVDSFVTLALDPLSPRPRLALRTLKVAADAADGADACSER